MKRSFALISLLLFYGNVSARSITDTVPQQPIQYYSCRVVEKDAQINLQEWMSYLKEKMGLDSASLDTIPAGRYEVRIQFVIDKLGNITDVRIYKDAAYGLGKRAAKIISEYKGCWEPASRNGRVVRAYRLQPIIFVVEEEEDCVSLNPAELIL